MLCHISRLKGRRNMITSQEKRSLIKIQYPFLIKVMERLRMKGTYFKKIKIKIKVIYDRLIAINHKGENLGVPTKIRNKTRMFTLPTTIQDID